MKKIALALTALAVAASLTGCSITAATSGTDSRNVELTNGGTIECVVVGGTSGSPGIYCVDATYIPPTAPPAE